MSNDPETQPLPLYKTGLYAIAFSLAIYLFPHLTVSKNEDFSFGIFVINYAISVIYLLANRKKKLFLQNAPVILVLFLISAYSLNKNIVVFEQSATWLTVALVISSINMLIQPVVFKIPSWAKNVSWWVTGVSLLLFLYLSIYLFKIYLFGIIGCFLLGFSLHAFLPIVIVIYLTRRIYKCWANERKQIRYVIAGAATTIVIVAAFVWQWDKINSQIANNYQQTLIDDNDELPGWIRTARHLPDYPLTEKYLKGELLYSMPKDNVFEFGLDMPNLNFEEARKHDPLIMIAGLLLPRPAIDIDERVKILESMYLSGHKTQERLWSGNNLKTDYVITNVRIWPEQRLAYTEKTITVANTGYRVNRWGQEEAIYTFHLAEGSVVTSLSLWIEDEERKGILTSKAKADSAYKQIVGVEQRDPSVVHWQEGNTVSVRVFPVPAGNKRIFKIGVTSPLTLLKNKLSYENVWFEGPDFADAKEIRQIEWKSSVAIPAMPAAYTQNTERKYRLEGNYNTKWDLTWDAPEFKTQQFSFDGYTYSIAPYTNQLAPANIEDIYLDINDQWTREEIAAIAATNKNMYVYEDEMTKMTENDLKTGKTVSRLLEYRFSMFPYHKIPRPERALVVTKGTAYSPSMKELKQSGFGKAMAAGMKNKPPIRVFNLGTDMSLYLRTLKEHRAFDYEQGDISLLKQRIKEQQFAHQPENDSVVVVTNSQIQLHKTPDTTTHKGNDQLMRLFTYNHIMGSLKNNLYPDSYADSALVEEAEQAYIVSPVSSLVVLETQEDYDRFGIKKSNNTLDNATLKSNGAVPEPHEWALILLAIAVVTYLTKKEQILQLLKR